MRTPSLFLLRHAKAERDHPAGDHERRLSERGRRDAALMGRLLRGADLAPDLVLTSSAVRARETADLVIEAARWRIRARERKAFYASTIERSLDVLRAIEGPSGVLAVGHEPTWSALAALLAGGGRVHLPTAGLAWIELDTDVWSDVSAGCGMLRALITPALAGAADPPSSHSD